MGITLEHVTDEKSVKGAPPGADKTVEGGTGQGTSDIVAKQFEEAVEIAKKSPDGLIAQTVLPQSGAKCESAVAELNNLSGRPLLEILSRKIDPDLSKYRFKQSNENETAAGPDDHTDPESMVIGDMRPGIYGQRAAKRAEISKDSEKSELRELPEYAGGMEAVFGGSKHFDLSRNHNGAKSAFDLMESQEKSMSGGDHTHVHDHEAEKEQLKQANKVISERPDQDTVLINFDSHADAWSGSVSKDTESIAQWVNGVIRDNPNVKEYYWVVPDNFKSDPELRKYYFDHKGPVPEEDNVFVHQPAHMELYFDKQSGALITTGKPKDYSEEKYRTIQFHKVTIDELPNLKDKRVAMSIDLDYFDNRGYDTSYEATVDWKGDAGFKKFVDSLKEKEIKPIFTTISASPEYVRNDHIGELMRFSSLVSEASLGKMDEVVVPKEHSVYMGEEHAGVEVKRDSKPLQLLYDLFKVDSEAKVPTYNLDINQSGPKLERALDLTQKRFGVDRQNALEVLRKLDKADGNENGVVEFERIEALLLRLCKYDSEEIKLKKNPLK